MKSILFLLTITIASASHSIVSKSVVPLLTLDPKKRVLAANKTSQADHKFLSYIALIDKDHDTSEYWRATELLALIRGWEDSGYPMCKSPDRALKLKSARSVHALCRDSVDFQLCPQCEHFTKASECELFQDSCKEKKVPKAEYSTYCDGKYGKWRSVFVQADYSQCRCCDECVPYRELDQSCVHDEFDFESEEFLPVSTIDFRAGCNPYLGHPYQETLALRCDKILRRCVPMTVPSLPKNAFGVRRNYRYDAVDPECPLCRGYTCPQNMKREQDCAPGAFEPDKAQCNCCGQCSAYFQLNQKCAEFKEFVKPLGNGSDEIEVEEEFLEPGCDDGLVCRQGLCQDIHTVHTTSRRKTSEEAEVPYEPCKREMKLFKKKYGENGHLHYEAPQCTPLWLYAPVQCRRFLCYCALEDGTPIEGIKVPRVEVSNMNCDCARERCRLGTDVECDGFGNYKEAMFTPHVDQWSEDEKSEYDDAKHDEDIDVPIPQGAQESEYDQPPPE